MFGKMEDSIKDNIKIIKSMAMEVISGVMVVNMLDNGIITKDMDMAE